MSDVEETLEPELRFQEFRDAEGWKKKPLGAISEIVRGGSPRPIEDFLTTDPEGLNWLKIGDVTTDSKYITRTREKVIKSALKKTREVHPGDLILSNSMSFGRPYILKIRSCIHDGWIAITDISSEITSDYLYYFISSSSCQNYFLNNAAGAVVQNLNAEIIKKLPTLIPDKPEQQKIANFLSSFDELITVQSRRLEALKAHKIGLLQHLFPAEGETVPKLRFPEFRNTGEWEEKPLSEFLSQHPDYGINAPAVPYSEELPTYLRITDISEDGYFLRDQKVSVAKEVTAKNYLSEGDIALARTGASVGKSYRYKKKDGKLVFAGFLIRVKPDEQRLRSEFLFHFLFSEQYWRWVAFTSARSGQPGINGNEYSTLPLPLPPSVLEQQKIADCLSSIDELITEQGSRIDVLKNHKKGLMQKLFPSPEGV